MTKEASLFNIMHGVIAQLKQLGEVRTSETYTATLKSFMTFREKQDIPLDGISSDLMFLYEPYLKTKGIRMNTISFYMRNLRAVYKRAVEKDVTPQNNPFRQVGNIPSGKIPYLLNNVCNSGEAAKAAFHTLGNRGVVLIYAMSDTLLEPEQYVGLRR